MKTSLSSFVRWAPRILGVGAALFLGLFALDSFSEGKPLGEALGDFAVHLLPTALLLVAVLVAWKYEWVGGLVFLGLAVAYALMVPQRPDWILVISGPLSVVGLLYLWSWRDRRFA